MGPGRTAHAGAAARGRGGGGAARTTRFGPRAGGGDTTIDQDLRDWSPTAWRSGRPSTGTRRTVCCAWSATSTCLPLGERGDHVMASSSGPPRRTPPGAGEVRDPRPPLGARGGAGLRDHGAHTHHVRHQISRQQREGGGLHPHRVFVVAISRVPGPTPTPVGTSSVHVIAPGTGIADAVRDGRRTSFGVRAVLGAGPVELAVEVTGTASR